MLNLRKMNLFSLLKGITYLVFNQVRNLVRLARGYPLVTALSDSGTLDIDDVRIAKKYIKNKKDWFTPDIVRKYENAFSRWNGSKHAFAFISGSVSLSACIHALDLKPGDEIILPAYTCVVVLNSVNFSGIKPVYSDIELDTYGLDAARIKEKITPHTKAILLHHLYGLVCRDYEKIIQIGRDHGLGIIEDCAQSTGALFKGRKIGNYGDLAIYSSGDFKVFTTFQGGMATTNNDLLAERLKEYYSQASYPDEEVIDKQLHNIIIKYSLRKDPQYWWKRRFWHYVHENKFLPSMTEEENRGIQPADYQCKMPAPTAEIGLNQLKKIDDYNSKRRQISLKWNKWCLSNGYKRPLILPDSVPVFLRYPVMIEPEKKKNTLWAREELGVRLENWITINIYHSDNTMKECPNTNAAIRQCVLFPTLM